MSRIDANIIVYYKAASQRAIYVNLLSQAQQDALVSFDLLLQLQETKQ